MGFFRRIFGKLEEPKEEQIFPSETETIPEVVPEKPIAIKPMMLSNEADVEAILKEVRSGNIVIVRYNDYASRDAERLAEIIQRLKESVMEEGGETVLIETKEYPPLLVVPHFIEVWRTPKRRRV